LKTLSTPILGKEIYPFVMDIGLHLSCIELLKIQSAFRSKLVASLLVDNCALSKMLFLTLFIVVKLKSKVDEAAF